MADKVLVLASVCQALRDGADELASNLLNRDYPFAPGAPSTRAYRALEATRVFVRDGFMDRYTGDRLIFPPAMRLISAVLPHDFPYHPNWRADVTHPAYWELTATVDHIVPVSKGGCDEEANWVTTSMARNSSKGNFTLDELGWELHPRGVPGQWDGLMQWFLEFAVSWPSIVPASVRPWQRAAVIVSSRGHVAP